MNQTMNTFLDVNVQTNLYRFSGIDVLRLDATLKELKERSVGKVVQSSAEYGYVKIVLQVEDEVVAKAKTVLIVAKRFPGHSYTVDVLKPAQSQQVRNNPQQMYEIASRYEFKRTLGMSR